MTPDQQRIAIAQACGWTPVQCRKCKPNKCACDTDKPNPNTPPNYLGDLNACHEMEKVLTDKGVNAWWAYVANINRNNPRPFGSESAVHATAAQRAEAFLRTLGLWTTTPTQPQ